MPLNRLSKIFYEANPRAGNAEQHIAPAGRANAKAQKGRADIPSDTTTRKRRVKRAKPKRLPPAPAHQ